MSDGRFHSVFIQSDPVDFFLDFLFFLKPVLNFNVILNNKNRQAFDPRPTATTPDNWAEITTLIINPKHFGKQKTCDPNLI